MRISFGTNIYALRANRLLAKTSQQLGDSYRILASGKDVSSKAAEALAKRLDDSARVASVAMRNTNDGISSVAVGIDGISQIIFILRRMWELASQSSSGTYTNSQRAVMALEFDQLGREADRTAATAAFNTNAMLSNSRELYIQVGIEGAAGNNTVLVPRTLATLESVDLRTAAGILTVSIVGGTSQASQEYAREAIGPLERAIETLNQRRAMLAATESRLSVAVSNLAAFRSVSQEAEGRIVDADFATEISKNLRLKILEQIQTALSAQANQNSKTVLQLIDTRQI